MKTKKQIKKDKKNYLAIALVVIMLVLAVGYASFSQTLSITGNVAGSATWNVHFVDASCGIVDSGSIVASSATLGTANAAGGNTSLTVDLTGTNALSYPGDAKKVRATIKNDSSMPIKLTGFTVTPTGGSAYAAADSTTATNSASDIWFDYQTLTKSAATPGVAATSGEILAAGETCTYEFVIGWLTGSTATSVSGSYTITLDYMQSTDSSALTSAHSHP